jgi:hypothetical protein
MRKRISKKFKDNAQKVRQEKFISRTEKNKELKGEPGSNP